MHTLRVLLATLVAAAVLVFGGAAWAATAFTTPTAPVVEVEEVAVAKALAPAPAHHTACEYGADTPIETIAWAEIARLELLGFPVCDTVWSFTSDMPLEAWGLAYPRVTADDPRPVIVIELDEEAYTGYDLEDSIRTTIRHEYAHVLQFAAGQTVSDAFEIEADAIAEALTPAGETRIWFYDETVTADELAAAQELLAPHTAQTL